MQNKNETKQLKYSTIQEYLDKYLYPILQIAMDQLIKEINTTGVYEKLVKEFNQNFFENKTMILHKERELLKLERGSDFSESDYDHFMKNQVVENVNESKDTNKDKDKDSNEEQKEDFDPDFDDDSEMLHMAEQELNREEEDKSSKFDPLNILAGRLIEVKHSMNENFDEDDLLGEQEK